MDHRLQPIIVQARRASVGRSVLGWLALAFLLGFTYWWYMVWADFLRPQTLLSPLSVLTIIIALCYAIVLPLFCSMVVPNSPAGRLLQKQTWALPGSILIAVLTLILLRYALLVYYAFLLAQPTVVANGMLIPALIAALTGSVGVPALCWAATTPEQWLAQLEQARQVRQMQRLYELEELAFKATRLRFYALCNADLASMTVEEFGQRSAELAAILASGQRREAQVLRGIAKTFGEMYGVEVAASLAQGLEDEAIHQRYREVKTLLDEAHGAHVRSVDYVEQHTLPAHVDSPSLSSIPHMTQRARDVTPPPYAHVDSPSPSSIPRATEHASDIRDVTPTPHAHVDSPSPSSIARGDESDAAGHSRTESDTLYVTLRGRLPHPFTAQNIADAMQWQDKRSGQRIIKDWLASKRIYEVRMGRYAFTERTVA